MIIAIIAAFASLVLNAYNYFSDRSLRHLYRATDYTSQSALNKATENRKLIDDLGGDFGAKVAELEKKYLDRIQGNDARILELDSRTTAMKTRFDSKVLEVHESLNALESQLDTLERKLADLTAKLNESLKNGDVVAKEIHKSLSILHTRQLEYTTKLNEIEAYINPSKAAVLPEPNEADLKQEMDDSLVGAGVVDSTADTAAAVENNAPDTTECAEPCGMNYCDENGCSNRKRVYVDAPTTEAVPPTPEPTPTPAPSKQRRKNGK